MIALDVNQLKEIETSKQFTEKLIEEEGVLVLPAECFLGTNGFRIVLCNPKEVLEECLNRLEQFIVRNLK